MRELQTKLFYLNTGQRVGLNSLPRESSIKDLLKAYTSVLLSSHFTSCVFKPELGQLQTN